MLLVLFLIFSSSLFFGQSLEKGDNYLSLEKAINIALSNNVDIINSRVLTEISENYKFQTFGIENPSFNYSKEGIRDGGFVEESWRVTQEIKSPLNSIFNYRKVSDETEAFTQSLKSIEKKVIKEVKIAYIELLFSDRIRKITNDLAISLNNLYQSVKEMVEIGESPGIDLLKAQIEVADLENELELAELNYERSRYELFSKIGLIPEKQVYELKFQDTLKFEQNEISQNYSLKNLEKNNILQAYDYWIKAKENEIKSKFGNFFPDISLAYYLQNYGNGFKYYGYEIGLKLPVWFIWNQLPEIEKNELEKIKLQNEKKGMVLQLKKEIEFAWHGYRANLSIVEKYETIIRKASLELNEIGIEGYKLGEFDIIRLFDANNTYGESLKQYYNALKDLYIELAKLESHLDVTLVK